MPGRYTERDTRSIRRRIAVAYFVLLALLGLTMLAGFVDLGWGNVVANMGIAAVKTAIVGWVFMHLYEATPLLRLFALGAIAWFGFLVTLGLGDWMTRAPAVAS